MGSTAVAALHYDMSHDIKRVSPRMAQAMRDMPGSRRAIEFGYGQVISWDHASGYQVCVIHGNTGWRIGADDTPPDVEAAVVEALRLRDWKGTKPRSKNARPQEKSRARDGARHASRPGSVTGTIVEDVTPCKCVEAFTDSGARHEGSRGFADRRFDDRGL